MAEIEKHIIYITDSFPLRREGLFTAKEYSFLKKQDFRLHLLPTIFTPNNTSDVDSVFYHNDLLVSKWEKLKYVFRFESVALIFKEFRSNFTRGIKPNFIKLVRSVGIALHAKNKIKRFILRNNLENCAVVIYSFWFNEVMFGVTLLRKEFPHIRFITRAHGGDIYPQQSRNGYLPFRFLRISLCDKILPCSEDGRQCLMLDGAKADVCARVYLGVDTCFELAPCSEDNELHIVSCSYIEPVKRLPLLVSSLQSFAKNNPQLKLVWHHLGGGEKFNSFQADVLCKLRTSSNITYTLHGSLSNKEILKFLQGGANCPLDVFINVSYSEGLPVSMMEAMSVGLPILATDVGGVNELVIEETGKLLPCEFTDKEFSRALYVIMDFKSQEKRKKIKEIFSESFNATTNYEFFIKEYINKELDMSNALLI